MASDNSGNKALNGITLGIAGLAAAIGAFLAPPYIKDKFEGLVMYGTQERTCYREYVDDLKDPYSAFLVNSSVLARPEGLPNVQPVLEKYKDAIEITVAAKNSFGAYKEQSFQCPMQNGMVNQAETQIWKLESKRY